MNILEETTYFNEYPIYRTCSQASTSTNGSADSNSTPK